MNAETMKVWKKVYGSEKAAIEAWDRIHNSVYYKKPKPDFAGKAMYLAGKSRAYSEIAIAFAIVSIISAIASVILRIF